ncbi:glycosyltransferase [Motiliproteus sediminis]|uniref:glycosyltransferase n=1 Tax=Motiliproteus sediminis TaxID=1468178 RepID=UPI001AEF3F98|nr:glycosyltransferase [Motiliproteus sediminis]
MKISIVGPYPPPYGGISNHIFRILPYLRDSQIDFSVFNQYEHEDLLANVSSTKGSYIWWVKFLFTSKSGLVHFHQFSWLHFLYLFFFSLVHGDCFLISIHNEKLLNCPVWVRKAAVKLLKMTRCKSVIVVSRSVGSMLDQCGVKNVRYLPAYVPPKTNFQRRNNHTSTTVLFNIWKVQDQDSIVKYGIDLLVDLAVSYPEIEFECFVAQSKNIALIETMLTKKSANNCVLRIGENLVDHFHRADLFLRLNRDDAYGVSIQEAMDCGVPAIASDVCERPRGALLFKNGCYEDLKQKFECALAAKKEDLLKDKVDTHFHTELIELYKVLLGKQ